MGSVPVFTKHAVEFGIVFGISIGIAFGSLGYFQNMKFDDNVINWIFWGIVGIPILIYYFVVRPLIFKRQILER